MKRVAFLALATASAVLFAWPMIPALSQWGGRAVCMPTQTMPAQVPPVGGKFQLKDLLVQGPIVGQYAQPFRGDRYEWKIFADDRLCALLYKNGVQVGGWDSVRQHYRELINYAKGEWGPPQERAPIEPPAHLVRARPDVEKHPLESWQLDGVKAGEICKHERYCINGQAVSMSDAKRAITAGLDDDSFKLWLSVWSKDPAQRQKIVEDLQRDPETWKWIQERCHVWDGPAANPEHWQEKDREGKPLHHVRVDPTITLQAPDGAELWRDEGYTQGPQSFDLLRKSDPKFDPNRTPGPNKKPVVPGENDFSLYLILAVGAIALLFLFPKQKDE